MVAASDSSNDCMRVMWDCASTMPMELAVHVDVPETRQQAYAFFWFSDFKPPRLGLPDPIKKHARSHIKKLASPMSPLCFAAPAALKQYCNDRTGTLSRGSLA